MVKRVASTDHLLKENNFYINGEKKGSELLTNLSFQKTNTALAGYPIGLHLYSLARPNRDSIFEAWLKKNPKRKQRLISKLSEKQLNQLKNSALGFNSWLKKIGEAPVVLDSMKIKKTKKNLERYYFSNGWFDRTIDYDVEVLSSMVNHFLDGINFQEKKLILRSAAFRYCSPNLSLIQKSFQLELLVLHDIIVLIKELLC